MKEKEVGKGGFIFVTGTDTDVGKTIASVGLVTALRAKGMAVQGLKPVAAGADMRDVYKGGLLNDDAYLLQQASSALLDYEQVNPFLFQRPIAPHLAAEEQGVVLTAKDCVDAMRIAKQSSATKLDGVAPLCVVEGAGGWRVPLSVSEDFSAIAGQLDASVVLVVAIKLGCLNHAVLTAEAVRRDGLELKGWVANITVPLEDAEQVELTRQNIQTLKRTLQAPLLAEIPFNPQVDLLFDPGKAADLRQSLSSCFDVEPLLS